MKTLTDILKEFIRKYMDEVCVYKEITPYEL